MKQFPLAGIVDGRPGGHRPVVIQLPEQRSHAVGHGGSPVFNSHLHRDSLLHLAEVEHLLEAGGETVVAAEVLDDDRVSPWILLMVFHLDAGQVPHRWLGIGRDGGQRGETLVAELTDEPGLNRVVLFKASALVPDRPEVHIPALVAVPVVREIAFTGRGTAWPPSAAGIEFLDDLADDSFVEPVVIDDIAVAVLGRLLVPADGSQILIVSTPQSKAGVIVQTRHLIP
ncbi:hypothetical protein SDC9_75585 [bioreactor metagenome]|uniref:Uncharacterized protein n=1 Tax=bioreactor metagenome TaxID=1076179 RepID=A0A644YKM4_9ZZZZ